MADPRTSKEVRGRVQELQAMLDPVHLLKEIRAVQQQLVDIVDRPVFRETARPTSTTLEQFLPGLQTAWREGEGRPTSLAKAKPKRSRRRPDPFAAVTVGVGIDPVRWTPFHLRRRCHQCRRVTDPMHRNSGVRWLTWSDPGAARSRCRASSNRPPRRSGTGCDRPIAMTAAVMTAHQRRA